MKLIKCGTEKRRHAVEESASINGIDYLEVLPATSIDALPLLLVRCFKSESLFDLGENNVIIEGGIRIKNIKIAWVLRADIAVNNLDAIADLTNDERARLIEIEPEERKYIIIIRPSSDGDFSTYTLRLIHESDNSLPPVNFDPILSSIDFTFKVECISNFDCKEEKVCPEEPREEPIIDYMAKDYASFRRLVLDRLSAIMPEWKERNPADLGIMLIELLAYVGDHLSYYQDAVLTEAYLGTARNRISIRRHARLLDYFVHEGCNSRVWVCFEVNSDGVNIPEKTMLLTGNSDDGKVVDENELEQMRDAKIFETMHDATFYIDHNEMHFYTWGESRCCLPRGATHATLKDTEKGLKIKAGDVLIFEEVLSPAGIEADADPSHRHAVRLVSVEHKLDELTDTKVIDIEWDVEDALPFPLCLWEVSSNGKIRQVSIARGNVVLADHGYTVSEVLEGNRSHFSLSDRPLTYRGTLDPSSSASSVFNYKVWEAMPDIYLIEGKEIWKPRRDLLSSDRFAREFVVEIDNDGIAHIRFGDGKHGMRPSNDLFTAVYRIGNGSEGNVGAESIRRIVGNGGFDPSVITLIRNPMPAMGGKDAEVLDDVRQNAPEAFRTQERAVTEADYEEVLKRHPEIQRARAEIRWTGSWYTVFVAIDRFGSREVDDEFRRDVINFLNRYRLAGYDLEISKPLYVALEIRMNICIDDNYFKEEVKKVLIEEFSSKTLPDGRRGFFHPDNFTFGQSVFLSKVYARAMSVDGVSSVIVERFGRRGGRDEIEGGMIKIGSSEIVRLDNDPNFPENGIIEFIVQGGR